MASKTRAMERSNRGYERFSSFYPDGRTPIHTRNTNTLEIKPIRFIGKKQTKTKRICTMRGY